MSEITFTTPPTDSTTRRGVRFWLMRGGAWIAILAVLYVVGVAGLRMRDAVFEGVEPVRYRGDLENAYRHGRNVIRLAREQHQWGPEVLPSWPATFHAYLNFYDKVQSGWPTAGYELDFPPMRLFVMTAWTRAIYQPGERLQPGDWPNCAIPLRINIAAEVLAAVAALLLVRHWVGRLHPPQNSWKPILCGVVAAILLWLNLAIAVDAHGWPQWDVWLVPFYLFTMLAGSTKRWLTAGLIFGFGIMFKGQLLVATPVLLLWPIFVGDWKGFSKFMWWPPFSPGWRGFGRLLTGLLAAVAGIQFMWLVLLPWALGVAIGSVVLVIALNVLYRRPLRNYRTIMIAACSVWVLIAAWLFGASFSWVTQGFMYGADHNSHSMASPGAYNLGSLLQYQYGWNQTTDELCTIRLTGFEWSMTTPTSNEPQQRSFLGLRRSRKPPVKPAPADHEWVITIGILMKSLYGLSLVLCAVGLAIHSRRNDPRALVAIAAPWLMFYALMPQLSSRYSLWPAAMTVLCAGVSVGSVLIHLLLSFLSAITILHVMILYTHRYEWWPDFFGFMENSGTGFAWITLLAAGVVLYLALAPSRGRALSDDSLRSPRNEESKQTVEVLDPAQDSLTTTSLEQPGA